MSAPRFTPGPWQVEDPFDFELSVVAHGDKGPGEWTFVASCKTPDEDDHDITFSEVIANASLIATAPKLYEQLHRLAERVIKYVKEEPADDEEEEFLDCDAELRRFAKEARQLLATARGEA